MKLAIHFRNVFASRIDFVMPLFDDFKDLGDKSLNVYKGRSKVATSTINFSTDNLRLLELQKGQFIESILSTCYDLAILRIVESAENYRTGNFVRRY